VPDERGGREAAQGDVRARGDGVGEGRGPARCPARRRRAAARRWEEAAARVSPKGGGAGLQQGGGAGEIGWLSMPARVPVKGYPNPSCADGLAVGIAILFY
jgi:hypothetical protein